MLWMQFSTPADLMRITRLIVETSTGKASLPADLELMRVRREKVYDVWMKRRMGSRFRRLVPPIMYPK